MVSRFKRSVVAAAAAIGLGVAGIATAPPAHAAAFSMSLVGGTLTLGTQQTLSLSSGFGCQNGSDDEFLAPFGTPDGLIDYPADPQCTSPYDDNERLNGFQPPDPVEFNGTIDGSGNFSVSSTFAPITLVRTSAAQTTGQCDDDVVVAELLSTFSDLAAHTGNINTGTLAMNLRLDLELDIQCDTDMGAGQTWVPYDFDGPGGLAPLGGATPLQCATSLASTNTSASGDSSAASTSKLQDPAVTGPMAGGNLQPPMLFGDVFDALPIAGADTRCPLFNLLVFGTANVDNSTAQWAMVPSDYDYTDLGGIDVNVGDVTVYEGDGGLGALGCPTLAGNRDCKNKAQVVVALSSPATVDSTVTVIADNTTGGSANGTPKGNEIFAPGPADYKHTTAAKPKVLKIRAGKSTAKFTINIVPDQLDEANETIVVKVTAVSTGLVINDGFGLVTINDDDDAVEPDTGINIGDAAVYETGSAAVCGGLLKCKGTAVVPITAESPVLADTSLTYTIANGEDVVGVLEAAEAVNGKTLGDDFKPVPAVPAKLRVIKTSKNTSLLVIIIFADDTDENGVFSSETLTVTVSGPGVKDGIGFVRIFNDDT
jgi:hypothetical protein